MKRRGRPPRWFVLAVMGGTGVAGILLVLLVTTIGS